VFPGTVTTTTVANILQQRCGSQISAAAGAAGTSGAAELAALGTTMQMAFLAGADVAAAGDAIDLAAGDDARPGLRALGRATLEHATDQLIDAVDDVGDEAADFLQDRLRVLGHRRGVVARAVPPFARQLAGEAARVLGDALAETLRVARDAAREVLGRMAGSVPFSTAMGMLVATVGHDVCSFG